MLQHGGCTCCLPAWWKTVAWDFFKDIYENYRDRERVYQWLTPQVAAMARAEPGWSRARSPIWVSRASGRPQALGPKWSSRDMKWHPRGCQPCRRCPLCYSAGGRIKPLLTSIQSYKNKLKILAVCCIYLTNTGPISPTGHCAG